jgi:hypothetical protein
LPVVPSVRLDDQSFQDNARIRLGVRNFTTMSQAWRCTCGQLVDGDDVAHALGCRSLNSLIIARHDETADALREYAGRLGFSSSREGPYMRRGSRTTNRPRARWDFHCHIRPGPGHVLGDVSFIHPLAPSYVHRSAEQAGSAARSRDQEKLNEYLRDHNCPGHTFRPISFESLGRFSDGAMTFIREVAHGAFPGTQAARARGRCFSNIFSHLAVVRCRHTSRMLTAAAGLQTAHTGSGWLQGSHHPTADMLS